MYQKIGEMKLNTSQRGSEWLVFSALPLTHNKNLQVSCLTFLVALQFKEAGHMIWRVTTTDASMLSIGLVLCINQYIILTKKKSKLEKENYQYI